MSNPLGGGSKKSSSSKTSNSSFNTKSTQQLTPWQPTMQGLQTGVSQANEFMNNPMTYYPGQTYLNQSQGQLDSLDQLYNTAEGNVDISQDALGLWQDFTAGPDSNLWDQRLTNYSDRVGRDLNRNIIPGINDQFIQAGGRRSSRAGIAEGLARAESGRDVMDYNNQLAMSFEGLKSQQQQFALGMTPQMMNTMMAPGNQMYDVENRRMQDDRFALNENMERYNYDQYQERAGMMDMMQMLNQTGGAFGTTRGTSSGTENQTQTSRTKESGGGDGWFGKLAGLGLTAAGLFTGGGAGDIMGMASGMFGRGGGGGGGGIGYDPFMSSNYGMNFGQNPINPQFASGSYY